RAGAPGGPHGDHVPDHVLPCVRTPPTSLLRGRTAPPRTPVGRPAPFCACGTYWPRWPDRAGWFTRRGSPPARLRRDFGTGRCDRIRIRVALAAPPLPVAFSRGVFSSRTHMVNTAPSGRSWLMRGQ